MKYTRTLPLAGAAAAILVLILDSQTSLTGASAGVELCLRTVIPSLFPFFVLSVLVTGELAGRKLPALRPLGRLCGVSQGGEVFLAMGFLGGYPVGAQCIHTAYRAEQLDQGEANRLLMFCSNAGPAFLFGMVAPMFPSPLYAWILWGIHVLSAVCVSICVPPEKNPRQLQAGAHHMDLTTAMARSLRAMAGVCGWIILFRVLISYLERWVLWLAPVPLQVLMTGFLELSNGCCSLGLVENTGLRFLICSCTLAFGGICVALQTKGVTGDLDFRYYLRGKLLQTLFSGALSCCVLPFLVPTGAPYRTMALILACSIPAAPLILRKIKKRGGFLRTVGV